MITVIQKLALLVSLFWMPTNHLAIESGTTISGKVTDAKSGEPTYAGLVLRNTSVLGDNSYKKW